MASKKNVIPHNEHSTIREMVVRRARRYWELDANEVLSAKSRRYWKRMASLMNVALAQ